MTKQTEPLDWSHLTVAGATNAAERHPPRHPCQTCPQSMLRALSGPC